MTQTRSGALDALETVIGAALSSPITFEREPEKAVDASRTGVVIMTEGDPGQPEVILSPVSYAFDHDVEFEITAGGPNRKATVDAILAKFEPALSVDRTLGAAVDDARIMSAPSIREFESLGAEAERSAVLNVRLSYTTLDPAA